MIAVISQLQQYHQMAITFGCLAGFFFLLWGITLLLHGNKSMENDRLKQELRDLHTEIRVFHRAEGEIDRQFGAAFTEVQRRSRLR